MSDDDTRDRTALNEDGTGQPDENRTDWARLRSMTEDELRENALSDPDNPPLTSAELDRLSQPNPFRDVRQRLNLTVFDFAERFGIPQATALAWETGQILPDAGALVLLRVIEHDPDAVIRVVHSRAAD